MVHGFSCSALSEYFQLFDRKTAQKGVIEPVSKYLIRVVATITVTSLHFFLHGAGTSVRFRLVIIFEINPILKLNTLPNSLLCQHHFVSNLPYYPMLNSMIHLVGYDIVLRLSSLLHLLPTFSASFPSIPVPL